jgi:hypothetical protein
MGDSVGLRRDRPRAMNILDDLKYSNTANIYAAKDSTSFLKRENRR